MENSYHVRGCPPHGKPWRIRPRNEEGFIMTKGKIIKITEEIITIGMDNGTIKEVRRCDVDFTPKLEDLVDVF